MALKKIEEMDYYEILNVQKGASQREIERAYYLGKNTYGRDSLAYYSLLSEEERHSMLDKIEEAYENLKDPAQRKTYDLKILKDTSSTGQKAYFRQSIQKLVIEDAEEKKSGWKKIKNLFSWGKKKG
ncbi:MAG: DnaJ domain-containing protein [Candidatus Aminicenantes bacterium]